MITRYEIAKMVSTNTPLSADRYSQISAIKHCLNANSMELWSTDREFIDDVLDILFDAFGYQA